MPAVDDHPLLGCALRFLGKNNEGGWMILVDLITNLEFENRTIFYSILGNQISVEFSSQIFFEKIPKNWFFKIGIFGTEIVGNGIFGNEKKSMKISENIENRNNFAENVGFLLFVNRWKWKM